jgi:hypothetical protein
VRNQRSAVFLSFAKSRGMIVVNVCWRSGHLFEADRTDIIWTGDHFKKFCAAAQDALQFSFVLALRTAAS